MGWQVQTLEDGTGGLGRMDDGKPPHACAAAWTLQHIDGENSTQEVTIPTGGP
jgi:hypothetical protein